MIRSKISKGYHVVVPSALRKRFGVSQGDEVLWISSDQGVVAEFRKKPSVMNIAALGVSGRSESSVTLKKKIQNGEL